MTIALVLFSFHLGPVVQKLVSLTQLIQSKFPCSLFINMNTVPSECLDQKEFSSLMF